MVVRVHGFLRAKLTAEYFDSAVRDDLVRIHVALRTTPGLEDDEREVVKELARDDLCERKA